MSQYYRIKVDCPRCGKTDEIISSDAIARVCCGDCLMNDIEVVSMTLTPLSVHEDNKALVS